MNQFCNQMSNVLEFFGIAVFLATEGVKSIAALWGYALKGKRAFCVFLTLLALTVISQTGGFSSGLMYVVMTAVRALSAVGIYSFLSRLYDALGNRK